MVPNKGGCSPPDGSFLIFTKREGTACNATDQIFLLDQDGVIYFDKRSKKELCPQGNSFLVLLSTLRFLVYGIIYEQYLNSHQLFSLSVVVIFASVFYELRSSSKS